MSDVQHFLLVFDHDREELIDEQHFGTDSPGALKAYSEYERFYEDTDAVEIVLVGSDSIETVRTTHANYYDGSVARSKYLAGLS